MLSVVLTLGLLAPAKPNVVLFLVDDLGWQDTSLSFGLPEKVVGRQFKTPNLEKLAARGTRVDQAYSACPVCTPSRVAILTGVNPARNHITSWVHSGQDTESKYPGLESPKWETRGFLPGTAKTLPQLFREHGYETVQIGKAHFGAEGFPGADPTALGFDRSIGGSSAGNPSSYYGLDNFAAKKKDSSDPPGHNDVPGLKAYHGKDVYLEDALATEAEKVIRGADKPLFLWYAPYAVHTPIQPNKRLLAKYAKLDKTEAAYATMVESFDEGIGRIVSALRKKGRLDNTIFLFTSDNGGLSQVARGGYPNLHNLPLRSGKGSAYEGGTRVPFVIAGPGIPSGRALTKLWLTGEDLFSTIAEMAGIEAAPQDGTSYANALMGKGDEVRSAPAVWHFPHHRGWGGPGLEPFSSIRSGDFKAIFFYGTRTWELYNIKGDLGETRDLARSQPAKLKELAQLLSAELERMGAQYPKDEKTGQPVRPEIPTNR